MMTQKLTNIKLHLLVAGLVASLIYVMGVSGSVGAQVASRCKNNEVIPTNVRQAGTEYEYCRDKGGYAGSDTGRCDNGDRIPQTQVGDEAKMQSFCASRLGYSAKSAGVNNPTTANNNSTGNEPKFVLSDCNNPDLKQDNCGIIKYLVIFINALSALVGIIIVIVIIVGGIQYSASADNPQAAAAAKKRIAGAVGALLIFIFMFAFLNYIVPGGVL